VSAASHFLSSEGLTELGDRKIELDLRFTDATASVQGLFCRCGAYMDSSHKDLQIWMQQWRKSGSTADVLLFQNFERRIAVSDQSAFLGVPAGKLSEREYFSVRLNNFLRALLGSTNLMPQ
jgi:hypothetical protein